MTTYPLEVFDAVLEKPPLFQTVLVAGGIAAWTGVNWLSRSGACEDRPITWDVEWWAAIPSNPHLERPKSSMPSTYGGLV